MRDSQCRGRMWFFCSISGFALMNLALFLHPMSPEDFLRIAFSDPLHSVFDAQGGGMAIFFWTSAALALSGLVGLLTSSRLVRHLRHRHDLRALTN